MCVCVCVFVCVCVCFQSNTTVLSIQFSGNKFRPFRPSTGHHYIKSKRLVTCTVR